MSAMPKGIEANWALSDLDPEAIAKTADSLIEATKAKYDALGALDLSKLTVDNLIKPMMELEREYDTAETPIDFAQYSATVKAVREASLQASKKLSQFTVDLTMRKDIFDRVVKFKESVGLEGLTSEEQRYVEKEIIQGKRNGLHLDEAKRKVITELKKKISDLGNEYGSNLNEDNTTCEFAEAELEGLPADLINQLERTDSGKLKLTMKYPHVFPVTRKCRHPETRKRMQTAYLSKCKENNTKILEDIIQLRHQLAQALGYPNHASYVQELRMAKNPQKVQSFLSGLAQKLQPIWTKERAELLKLKEEECRKHNMTFTGTLDFWDVPYFTTKVEEIHYAVDQEQLKQYFPMDRVTKGILDIYQSLLGLTFVHVPDAKAWHPDVKLYRVDDSQSGETMGYFFLDMHPRDGKYSHAAIFNLQASCKKPQGDRQVAVCAMMCNFAMPTEDKPSLLDHNEVATYFHEFGHVMHMICSRSDTVKFFGTRVERDFVEAPSQMLENWVWNEESINMLSGHYKDGSPIPKELVDKLINSRKANAGSFNLRQIILSTFDQRIHTSEKVDTQKLFAEIYKEIMDLEVIEGTNMPASWTHMVGYDAQYYGYLWSEVFSYDMFETRFLAEGLMNPKVGMDYRRKILQPGGTKDAYDLLRDFLGREPNDMAFLKAKGLD